MAQRNKSLEENSAGKNQTSSSEKGSLSHESIPVKLPVIASLAGTTKKISMVKPPAPPQKQSYHRSNFHAGPLVNNTPSSLQKTKAVSKVQGRVHMPKMSAQNLRGRTEEIETMVKDSHQVSFTDSNSNKDISKKEKLTKADCKKRSAVFSKANQHDLDNESGRMLRKRSKQPSVRSAQEQLEEAKDVTRPDASKIYEENFQQSKPEEPTSTPASPVRVVARSIDEIIASLQSTSPSPSEQTIKELPESVLGQNYNIKMEQAAIKHQEEKIEPQASKGVLPSFRQPSLWTFSFPKKSPVIEKGSQAGENESQPKELSTHIMQVKQTPFPDVMQVKGRGIVKVKFRENQRQLEEGRRLQQQSPLQSPQTSNVKLNVVLFIEVKLSLISADFGLGHYPEIHRLCTAFPSFILPPDLQLASRIYHTRHRRGHNILFTAEDLNNKEEEPTCSKNIYLKEQAERERICYEGIPISEQFQKDRIHALPPYTSKSLTGWQKIPENCLKKPQLELLGEKVSIYPGALKMFWTPAPPKFSAPISYMKELLFPTYKSNLIEGVVFEDFTDHQEDEELEPGDHDFYHFDLAKLLLRRSRSLTDISETEKINVMRRSISAPEMTTFKDNTMLKMSANFKTSMKELKFMKQQIAETKVETDMGKSFPTTHLLREICDDLQSVQTDKAMEKTPASTGQEDSESGIVPAEKSQKTGIKRPVFARKKKTKKSRKTIDPRKLEAVIKKLSEPPRILKRCESLGRLPIHDKFSIKVSSAVRQYRSPSIPCILDFEKFVKVKGEIPKDTSARKWVSEIWDCWFEETFPASRTDFETSIKLLKGTKKVDVQEADLRSELVDSMQPVLLEDAAVSVGDLEEEVRRLTVLIEKEEQPLAFHYCRRGAIRRKLGKLKSAMDDLEKAISLEPLLLDAYWHRHLIYLFQERISAALDDLNFISKSNKNKADAYLSKAEIYKNIGDYTLAIVNYTSAIQCSPTDDDTYFKRAELYFEEDNLLLAMDDYAKHAMESFKMATKLMVSSGKTLPNTFEAAEMHYLIGLCYMERVNLLQARDAFSTAIRLHSTYADAFYQRGLCRMQLGQAACIQDFNQALALCPSHFQAYMSRAVYYGSKGRYSKAILNCNEALKINPNSVRAYFYRGTLKYQNKTYQVAIEDLSKTIDLNKSCVLAYYNRAVSYHQIKDFRKALKDYGILLLLELNKEIVLKVLINRGLLYVELGDYSNACEDFKEATLHSPFDSQIFQAIGVCYHRINKFEEAVRSFNQVLRLDPLSVDAYVARGNSYMENRQEPDRNQAQKDFLKALHLNPKCVKARIGLGYNLQALGKFQKAWNQFTVAIDIDPKCHAAYDGRASVCLEMGDTFAAFQDTNAALKLTTTAALLTNRGVINQFMGYLSCAMRDYQNAISVDPDYALAYFNAANIYFRNRQFSQALGYYSKALQLEPRNESAVLNRAITNTLLKNIKEAIEDFEKAVSLCPFSAAVYFNRANLFYGLKQYELADKDISTALSIQPNDALMYKFRADIRAKLGFRKEAVDDYKQAISIQEQINSM
ncbi:tetratricopeptide repeat protein 6 [Eudromia elegans]